MKAKIISGAPGGARTRLADVLPLKTPFVVQIFSVVRRLDFSTTERAVLRRIRAYSCGAVADFHRLPEHPST